MPDQPHDQAEELLPWYATGQLDAADRALVEKHLASCARCERQLAAERALIHEYQGLTPEIDTAWHKLRGRIVTQPRSRLGIGAAVAEFWELLKRPAVAALATAQMAFVAIGATVLQWSSQPTYVALGSAPVAASANVIVMFRPEVREAELRGMLESSGASLVGGPTEADAYLLHVPAEKRPSALDKLQKNANVTMEK